MGSFLKVQNILTQMMSDSTAQRLAHSRNRVPTLGGPYVGPYGTVLPSRGWVRS